MAVAGSSPIGLSTPNYAVSVLQSGKCLHFLPLTQIMCAPVVQSAPLLHGRSGNGPISEPLFLNSQP